MQDPSDGRSGRAAATSSVLWPCSDASTPADGPAQRGTSGADSGTNALRTRAQTVQTITNVASLYRIGASWYRSSLPARLAIEPVVPLFVRTDDWKAVRLLAGHNRLWIHVSSTYCTSDCTRSSTSGRASTISANGGAVCLAAPGGEVPWNFRSLEQKFHNSNCPVKL